MAKFLKPLEYWERVNIIDAINARLDRIKPNGRETEYGEGLKLEDGKVSVDNGDYLKFVDNKLAVDRDALNIPEGGSTVTAGSGIAVEDGKVSVDNGDYLKFVDNKLAVDRDALNIPEGSSTVTAGSGIAVEDGKVSVDNGDYLKFVGNKLAVDRAALNIPEGGSTVTAGSGIAVEDGKVSVDNGDYLLFVDNKLAVDRDALNIPEGGSTVTAGSGIEIEDGIVSVIAGDGLTVDTSNKLNVNAGNGLLVENGGTVQLDYYDKYLQLNDAEQLDVNALQIVSDMLTTPIGIYGSGFFTIGNTGNAVEISIQKQGFENLTQAALYTHIDNTVSVTCSEPNAKANASQLTYYSVLLNADSNETEALPIGTTFTITGVNKTRTFSDKELNCIGWYADANGNVLAAHGTYKCETLGTLVLTLTTPAAGINTVLIHK